MNAFSRFLLLVAGSTAVIVILALLFTRSMRWAKSRPPSLGSVGWALLFFASGRMPPPPPKTHIEQEASERKNREIDRNDES